MDLLQWLTTGGAMTALGLALATYLKTRPAMKAEQTKGEAALWTRIAALEAKLEAERSECERRINDLKETVSDLQGQMQVLRHDRNNMKQGFNALIAMLKQPDADIPQIVVAIEDMVDRGEQALSLEKGSMRRKN